MTHEEAVALREEITTSLEKSFFHCSPIREQDTITIVDGKKVVSETYSFGIMSASRCLVHISDRKEWQDLQILSVKIVESTTIE